MEADIGQQYYSVQELFGIRDRRKYLGPMKFNQQTHSQIQPANSQFTMNINSSGSLIDLKTMYIEFQVSQPSTTTGTQFFSNYLQFLQCTGVRLNNINFKYRDPASQLSIAMLHPDFDDMRQQIGLNDSSVCVAPSSAGVMSSTAFTPTCAYLSSLSAQKTTAVADPAAVGLFPVRIPIRLLAPELGSAQSMDSLWCDAQNGISLNFVVGSKYCLIDDSKEKANQASFDSIQNIRICYNEQYPHPDMLSRLMSSTISMDFPFYDVQYSAQSDSGSFNFSINPAESYKKLILSCVFYSDSEPDNRSGTVAEAVLDDYATIYNQNTYLKSNSCILMPELSSLELSFPGKGKFVHTRNSIMSLGIMNKHRSLVDRIFRTYIEISLAELPYQDADNELIRGSELAQSGQLTVNYKFISATKGQLSVPYYDSAAPTGLGTKGVQVQAILVADKQVILRNSHYRIV